MKGDVSLDADWQIGYKRQMEIYQWLLRKQGLKVSSQGWFLYCNGKQSETSDVKAFEGKLDFKISMLPYEGDDSWIDAALMSAKACLDTEPYDMLKNEATRSSESCLNCKYRSNAQALEAAVTLTGRGGNAELEVGSMHLQARLDEVAAAKQKKMKKVTNKDAKVAINTTSTEEAKKDKI